MKEPFLSKIHARRFAAMSVIAIAAVVVAGWLYAPLWALFVIVGPIVVLGTYDVLQTENTVLRNFPVVGHLRFLAQGIGPEIHQYFVESDTSGRPFNRNQRDFVNQRANDESETHPFGTQLDVYAEDYEWAPHSVYPEEVMEEVPTVCVGGDDCTQPYDAALFNISAMSFGSLSANAVLALNAGAAMGGFLHNTGEGGLSKYHLEHGADLTWEIGSGYFGCRTEDGDFDPEQFADKARGETVKMIELKLSQGAKPGHGGVLPASKNTPEIAETRGVEPHQTIVSPAYHRAFSDAEGLLTFVARLRELSGGKPTGFKLCIGGREEFIDICEAMVATGIRPDFVTVDGSEGGTGAAPIELSNRVGMPLEDALVFVEDCLRGYGLRDEIRIFAAGKIVSAFDIIRTLALGADVCNSARGMMFALGCIQALKCDTNRCPTGVATHDPGLTRGLVVRDKAQRVAAFQRNTVKAACELLAGMGLERFHQLERRHIRKRTSPSTTETFADLYPPAPVGAYLEDSERRRRGSDSSARWPILADSGQ